MRKVILGAGITLDGYLARPDGSVDYLVMSKEGAALMARFFATIDTIVMGRKTLDAAIAMMGGSFKSPVDIPHHVFSRTQPPGERDGVIFTNQSPAAWLRKIRARRGKHIYHMGGGELARSFLQADLIDELFLGIVPILLGDGLPLFPRGFPQRDFTLVENKTYSKSQIALTYQRVRSKRKRK
ncbi:MAG TPA: dihydrofolate reductase family protein [Bryobacteraceae bacterium]|nr:dihydrofolate reductase family protein [Bryobacteraceae bacterium]